MKSYYVVFSKNRNSHNHVFGIIEDFNDNSILLLKSKIQKHYNHLGKIESLNIIPRSKSGCFDIQIIIKDKNDLMQIYNFYYIKKIDM